VKKYSTEYWLHHYEYAMGYKEKTDIDTSNAQWTKSNIKRILNKKFPHGMTGTNILEALIEFVKKYHPEQEQEVVKLMLEYIESTRQKKKQ
jgi:hypothetical protein